MTFLTALFLGALQGLTEFFPVSSSGHLELAEHLLGLTELDHYILFDLVCHLGTLSALLLVFRTQIREMLTDRTIFLKVVLGTLPLFPLVFVSKFIRLFFNYPQYLGYAFLVTALLLYLGILRREALVQTKASGPSRPWRDALIIGCFQALAIIPGISRSGATISAGYLLGWKPKEAMTFSFLLAIPAILGGVIVELLAVFSGAVVVDAATTATQYFTGFIAAFGTGYLTLKILESMIGRPRFSFFVWYCLFIGIISLVYFNLYGF